MLTIATTTQFMKMLPAPRKISRIKLGLNHRKEMPSPSVMNWSPQYDPQIRDGYVKTAARDGV